MLLYDTTAPDPSTFAKTIEEKDADQASASAAANRLWNATRDLGKYRDNSNAESSATAEAYARRNKAIFDATGVQLANPVLDFTDQDLQRASRLLDAGGDPMAPQEDAQRLWQAKAAELARAHPDKAGIIQASRPIREDALAITKAAETEFGAAQEGASGLGWLRRLGNVLGGGLAGGLRDPVQVGTLFLGGPELGFGKTVLARVLETTLTEAAVNAGVEGAVQAASQDWKKQAGVENGLGPALEQIGLAGAFGGAFGGLLGGGRAVFHALGRKVPDEVLTRAALGDPEAIHAVAEAAGRPLDPDQSRLVNLAAEQADMDRDAFGPPPEGMAPAEAERGAAEAVRAVEEDAPSVQDVIPDLTPDPEETASARRYEQRQRILRKDVPLPKADRQPQTLMQFIAGAGGLKDEGGELAGMDLGRKFIPRYGPLVRRNGRDLDAMRELVAEAGFFGDRFGTSTEAVARSTPADLLDLIGREAGGERIHSRQEDGDRIDAANARQAAAANRETYEKVLQEISGATRKLGITHELDDAVVRRAAALVDETADPRLALEQAIEEDYRAYADALDQRGEGFSDEPDADIPFFSADGGPGPEARGDAGAASQRGPPRGPGADAAAGQEFPRAGAGEGRAVAEPATPQAAEAAADVLTEARRPATEKTASGEQTLIPGVEPVTTKQRIEAEGAKAMRGGDAPAGGLFDESRRQQLDIWDTMPAGKDAAGDSLHVTHEDMIADADRTEFFGDLIASCKD